MEVDYIGRQVLGGVRVSHVWVKATPRPLRVETVGAGQDSPYPGDLSIQKIVTQPWFIPHPKIPTWPLIWFFTLLFTMLFWFRTVPFKFSNPFG